METIQADKMVTMRYVMKTHLMDGTLKDHPEEEVHFIFGVDRQVPTLEKALEGAGVGEKINVTIPAEELYGDHDPSLVREIPKKGLIKQRLKAEQFYRQMKKGCLISFKVVETRPNTVLADFNRPLAGIRVSVDLQVLSIREAEKKEIDAAMEAQVKRSIGCG
jgi:FKBP-type peptidyl-prolyl cis-trans isomerase SlyD